jgi:predicted AlkP superfamily phosphohydrolase/phosphomutase
MPEESDGYVDEKIDSEAFQAQMDEIESERDKMFWSGFEDFKSQEKGLYSFVYDTSDRMQHCYWDEKALAEDAGVLSVNPVVVDYYINKDKFVGNVLDELDNKTALLIVSDHGFTSFERAVDINRWLYENGYIALKDGAEITAEDDGSLFKHVDWNKTKAFSVGFNSIYINTKGRESKGSVKSSDKDNVINEIVTKLEAMKDEKTGKNPINKAYKSREIHSGKYLNDAPDIIIGFSPGYRMGWKTAVGGFDTQVISDNIKKWNGDHLVDPKFVPGVLFSNMKLSRKSANQMDVAATVLDVFGIGIPSGMDGKSLVK